MPDKYEISQCCNNKWTSYERFLGTCVQRLEFIVFFLMVISFIFPWSITLVLSENTHFAICIFSTFFFNSFNLKRKDWTFEDIIFMRIGDFQYRTSSESVLFWRLLNLNCSQIAFIVPTVDCLTLRYKFEVQSSTEMENKKESLWYWTETVLLFVACEDALPIHCYD